MRKHLFPLALAALTAGAAAAVVAQLPGVNGPSEWQWSFHRLGLGWAPAAGAALAAIGVVAVGAVHAACAGGGAAGAPEAPLSASGAGALARAGLARRRRSPLAPGSLPGAPGGGGLADSSSGAPGTREAPRALQLLLLPLLLLLGGAFTLELVTAQPGGWARVTRALVSRQTFGYVWDAASAPDTAKLLADYPAAAASLHQHSITHPPGPLLAVRALDWLGSRLGEPGSGSDLAAQAARSIAFEIGRARAHDRPFPDPPPRPWTVAALALLLPIAATLAGWPLFGLAVASGLSRPAALYAVVLWLLVPARSLFTPSLDQALPLLLLSAAWLAAAAPRHAVPAIEAGAASAAPPAPPVRAAAAGGAAPPGHPVSATATGRAAARPGLPVPSAVAGGAARPGLLVRAAAAGLLLALACFLSYGCLALVPLIALGTLGAPAARRLRPPSADRELETAARRAGAGTTRPASGHGRPELETVVWCPGRAALPRLAALATAFLLPYLALFLATGFNPWQAIRVALGFHQRIAVAPRGYATWLLGNPYDFALLLSPVVLGLAAAALITRQRSSRRPVGAAGTAPPPTTAPPALLWRAALWLWWALLGLLLLSGSVRGEVGRIWLPWMPFACIFAAAVVAERWGERSALAHALPLCQALLALALAASMVFVS